MDRKTVKYNLDSGQVDLDLDIIGKKITAPSLNLPTINPAAIFGSQMQQLANINHALNAIFEPIRKAVQSFQILLERIVQPIRVFFDTLTKSLGLLVSNRPVYFVRPEPTIREQFSDRHLPVERNNNGFFVIGGRQLSILHPASSRCGRLFAALLKRKASLVSYEELQTEIGSGDLSKTFKDLKYQLKKQGYGFEYELARTQGIALLGVNPLQ